ncbi:sporulation protein YtfJ [Scopulibacillus daqui]|uniref:Sporulation protein YtfJ n=1 Tax=Scopulibacillus daqui TaxID=1469162 RepID=A0ABS2PZ31_9BACL|nr:GerW family sporulation protein [Scopulibacillus daqui]MBM7644820.1 sporulation protein YtfJ [Scopulibacillus daqui]
MSEHPIQGLMKTALESLQEMTDVNTIIGDPIETPDGNVILTVSKVGFGFAAGGSEFQVNNHTSGGYGDSDQSDDSQSSQLPFGGGSGGGVSITPIAFLIVGPYGVKTIHLDNSTHIYEKLLDLAPQAVDKIQQMVSNNQSNNKSGQQSSNSSQNRQQQRGGMSMKQRRNSEQQQDDFFN